MKNKLAQLYVFCAQIDRRYVQLAYFAFMLVGFLIKGSPSDGGGDPI